jgi:Calcineurin-like phosphoesterase
MTAKPDPYSVSPNSVYVWRGFKAAGAAYADFAKFLGSVFVPACALLQPSVGLRAYLPTMVPQAGKPAAVPDQTALMFWATPQSHDLAAQAIAVRIYQNLHGDAYDMVRSKLPEVPIALPATAPIQAEQPYFLLNQPADWMRGSVHHLVGGRRSDLSATDFLNAVYRWAAGFAKQPPKEIDAGLLCCGNDYLVAWVHSAIHTAALGTSLGGLAALTAPVLNAAPQALKLPAGLWDSWPGLDLTQDTCINIQLHRPSPTVIAPRPPKSRVPVEHFEVPHLALWKSCVAEVLAGRLGQCHTNAAGIDLDHPLMRATDRYCRSMAENKPLSKPPTDSTDEEAVLAYLSYLHHRRAHARIAGNPTIEADIEKQTQEYKFGNPLWQQMFEEYFKYYWQYPLHKGGSPKYRSWQADDAGKGDLNYGVIKWRLPANARIAIVGDIGTGTDMAAAVLSAALTFNPDVVLHLGDVYFSGTSFETEHRLVGLIRSVLGRQRVPLFTVPGNHEYFTGGISFLAALDAGHLVVEDTQQQVASYFCLRTADDGWQFLGLDTGYNGHYMNVPPSAQQAVLERLHVGKVESSTTIDPHWPRAFNPYFSRAAAPDLPIQNPNIQDPTSPPPQVTLRPDEAAWHQDKLAKFPGRSILLSHHQLYSALQQCGIAQAQLPQSGGSSKPDPNDWNRTWINTGLWRQLGSAFGDKVAAWIWGHEHNLGIYQDNYRPADWPVNSPDAQQIFKTLPKGRCAGHSAIPVQQSEAPYLQKFPVPLKSPELTLGLSNGWYNRGFQLLELAGAGKPGRISYFEVADADSIPSPIFVEQVE